MINKQFSTEFKDESELQTLFASLDRYKEMEEQVKELESLKEENLLIKQNYDLVDLLGSEDAVRVALFQKQFPDKNASVAYKLFSEDLSQMSDKDVVRFNMMLNTPSLDVNKAEAALNRKYGVSEDGEIEDADAALMTIDASTARREINDLKNKITLPDKVDVTALAQQQKDLREEKINGLKKNWSDIAQTVAKTLPDYSYKDDVGEFSYSVTQDFPKEVVENMVNLMAQSGQEISEDAVKVMGNTLINAYKAQNFDKIIKAAREDVMAKMEEKRLREEHNPDKPKPEAPPAETPNDISATILKGLQSTRSNYFEQ